MSITGMNVTFPGVNTELNGKFQVHLPNLKPQLTNDKDVESRKNSLMNSLKGYVGFFF